VCWHKRYTLGDIQPTEAPGEWLAAWREANPQGLFLCVYLIDHSGLGFSVRPFACPWDSGQVGYAVATAEELKACFPKATPDSIALEYKGAVQAELELYTQYSNGFVHCFRITDAQGDEVDSLHGIYGDIDHAVNEEKSYIEFLDAENLPLFDAVGMVQDLPVTNHKGA
jgi:hypothetical protein